MSKDISKRLSQVGRAELSFPTRSEYDIFSSNLELLRWFGGHGGLRLAYMTGEYPRVTDTFIQREVLALRALGHYVKTFSVRHPPDNESAGEDAAESRRTTIYLLPPRNLVGAHVAEFFRSPRNYFSAFKLPEELSAWYKGNYPASRIFR